MAGFGVPSSVMARHSEQDDELTQLKLLVIFPILNGSTAAGADFGLTRCRREFQHASRQRAPFAPGS
jgi:hypothetical protein